MTLDAWTETLRRLDWLAGGASPGPATAVGNQQSCWLRGSLAISAGGDPLLNPAGRDHVQRLVAAGWTLRNDWPRPWQNNLASWLGQRLYLGHASAFSPQTRYYSLISSHLGRFGHRRPDWPGWVDAAVQHVHRTGGCLLVAAGTTLAEAAAAVAHAASVPVQQVVWAQPQELTLWLPQRLGELCELASSAEPIAATRRPWLELSPPISPPAAEYAALPMQDRLAIAVADVVMCLTLRPGGKLATLVDRRLGEVDWPTASVFVSLSTAVGIGGSAAARRATPSREGRWLARGAVGWILPAPGPRRDSPLNHCRRQLSSLPVARPARAGQPALHSLGSQQLAAPLPSWWRDLAADDCWPYLVHCTRGTSGRSLLEGDIAFQHRSWVQGAVDCWQPLETLAHICHERRLRGTSHWTRSTTPCVSFSAVPLVRLLERRCFQSHLGRWDWEPYGVLILRSALQALGARGVLYGDEAQYAALSAAERLYFQPRQRKQAGRVWSSEREWRKAGDVDLRGLPAGAVVLFVDSQQQAQQLARYAPWPVVWTRP